MGEVTEPAVYCGQCSALIDAPASLAVEQRQPCPACGSLQRTVKMTVTSTVTAHGSLAGVQTRPDFRSGGRRRPVAEFFTGRQPTRDPRSPWPWVIKDWLLDRVGDRYREHVVAPDGTVVRNVEESLREHQGRGSARRTGLGGDGVPEA